MTDEERRTKEMGVRVVLFNDRHPEGDAGYIVLTGRLKGLVSQMDGEELLQRSALMDRHTSTLDKRRILHDLQRGPIASVVHVALLAAKDEPSLASQVRYSPSGDSQEEQFTAARDLLQDALGNKEVLAKYGLSDGVLEVYQRLLSQFEAAVTLGNESRAGHKGATPNLGALAIEIRRTVRTMSAHNRMRFKNDPKLQGEWASASSVNGRPGPSGESEPEESPAPGGGTDVKPAA